MKSAGTIAVILLLPIFVVGCKHKTQAAPPPAAQAPILPPSTMSQAAPPPELPPPQTPEVKLPDKEQPPPQPAPHRTKRTKPKPSPPPATSEPAAATPPPTEQAAVGQPSEASPIGQLSTASDSVNTPPRQKIQDQVNSTENGLKRLKQSLSTEDQKIVTQIRTFLDKAKQALAQDDLDGAQTLVTKAKVLLDELTSKE